MDWLVLDDEIFDPEVPGVQLAVDGAGKFHLVHRQEFIDGSPVGAEHCRLASFAFSQAGLTYDPERVSKLVQTKDISGREAAKLWLNNVVPESLAPFLCVRA